MIFYEVVNFILVCHFCILLKFPYSLGFLHLFHRISFYPRAQLLDLAVSLLPGLDAEDIALLFEAIKPALQVWLWYKVLQGIFQIPFSSMKVGMIVVIIILQDAEGVMQKKAYKVLSIILRVFLYFILFYFPVYIKLQINFILMQGFHFKILVAISYLKCFHHCLVFKLLKWSSTMSLIWSFLEHHKLTLKIDDFMTELVSWW